MRGKLIAFEQSTLQSRRQMHDLAKLFSNHSPLRRTVLERSRILKTALDTSFGIAHDLIVTELWSGRRLTGRPIKPV